MTARTQGKSDATMRFVEKTARRLDPDPGHDEQVTRLALALFDELGDLHGLAPADRRLLEIAGRLHDIGWSRVVGGKHHKHSRDLILELDIPGLSKADRRLCALVARYHTKAEPDPERHRRFAGLEAPDRRRVEWLAGILRVADGLDREHEDAIDTVRCAVTAAELTIALAGRGDLEGAHAGAARKDGLLARAAERRIRYSC